MSSLTQLARNISHLISPIQPLDPPTPGPICPPQRLPGVPLDHVLHCRLGHSEHLHDMPDLTYRSLDLAAKLD